jgi:hypothetical protein
LKETIIVDSFKVVQSTLVVWKFKEIDIRVKKNKGVRIELGKGMKMRV